MRKIYKLKLLSKNMPNENLEEMTKDGLLPICSVCRAVRIGEGESEEWLYSDVAGEKGELYNQLITKYGKQDRGNGEKGTKFTYTYCPTCAEKIEEEIDVPKKEKDDFHW